MSFSTTTLKLALIGGILLTPSTGAWADGNNSETKPSKWSAELGAAVLSEPDYEGSNDFKFEVVPLIKLSWGDRIWVKTMGEPGIYARPIQTRNFSADIGVRYDEGRDEGDNEALVGLGDLDVGMVFVGELNYKTGPISTGLRLDYDLEGDRDGTTVTLDSQYRTKLNIFDRKVSFSVGPHVTWANADYMSNTFGVSSVQAANSAVGLSQFDAGSGIKNVGAQAMLKYPLSEKLSLVGFAEYNRLLGDAAGSPLVVDHGSADQFKVGFGVNYRW